MAVASTSYKVDNLFGDQVMMSADLERLHKSCSRSNVWTPWASAPAYLVRDNDGAYGHVFRSRVGSATDQSRLDRRGKMAMQNG